MSHRLRKDYLLCSEVQAGTEMGWNSNVVQLDSTSAMMWLFLPSNMEESAAVIVFDCGLCVKVFAPEYAQPSMYL